MSEQAQNVVLADEAATARLGADLAMTLRAGDVVALSGELGAGKTTLARAMIRANAQDPSLEVPSPTFTLVQAYDGRVPLQHYDLYRLRSADELDELGLDEAVAQGAVVVEWPERGGNRLPAAATHVRLENHGDGRLARLAGQGASIARIVRSLEIREFLETAGWGAAGRRPFVGDASSRSYEIATLPGFAERVLMNAPRQPDGPPIRNGLPYSRIAHLAESVTPFVAVARALAAGGVTVPAIHAQDLDRGLLLIEHLGDGAFLVDGQPVRERYVAAAGLLAMMHRQAWPTEIEAAPDVVHEIPLFDRDAMMIEVELLLDWYVPFKTGQPASAELRQAFRTLWSALFERMESAETSLVLRDFHSPNIVWRSDRRGHDRLGVIDFQDALIGPSAYDVASLAMDARVTIPVEIERAAIDAYVAARAGDARFDPAGFAEAYAVMAAQRNSKILGIFVRLDRRDGKPAYLKHLPRIRDYMARAFAHPTLSQLAALYRDNGLLDP